MKQYFIIGALVVSALFVLAAAAPVEKATADVIPSKGHASVSIPASAVKVNPGVFSLGTAVVDGKVVEGYAFVHYKEAPGKPGTQCGNGVCEKGENVNKCPADCGGGNPDTSDSKCYGYLAKGAKWKTPEYYYMNLANSDGLDYDELYFTMEGSISKWEGAAQKNIINTGNYTSIDYEADTVKPDGLNEVYFGSIEDSNAIAVTIVWGIFGGPPNDRELIEWDMVFDEQDYDWSLTGESGKMDFENIATHELGHAVGMDDLYNSACSEQTMYGYATEGETKKRTLESGDITGVKKLYS